MFAHCTDEFSGILQWLARGIQINTNFVDHLTADLPFTPTLLTIMVRNDGAVRVSFLIDQRDI